MHSNLQVYKLKDVFGNGLKSLFSHWCCLYLCCYRTATQLGCLTFAGHCTSNADSVYFKYSKFPEMPHSRWKDTDFFFNFFFPPSSCIFNLISPSKGSLSQDPGTAHLSCSGFDQILLPAAVVPLFQFVLDSVQNHCASVFTL